jgi:excisionase family DNA binding protein
MIDGNRSLRSGPSQHLMKGGSSSAPEGALDPGCSSATESAIALPTSDSELPRVLTPEELAAILRLRKRSVYEAINRGDIPGVRRIGRKIRIDRDCVLAWLTEGHGRVSRSSRR